MESNLIPLSDVNAAIDDRIATVGEALAEIEHEAGQLFDELLHADAAAICKGRLAVRLAQVRKRFEDHAAGMRERLEASAVMTDQTRGIKWIAEQ